MFCTRASPFAWRSADARPGAIRRDLDADAQPASLSRRRSRQGLLSAADPARASEHLASSSLKNYASHSGWRTLTFCRAAWPLPWATSGGRPVVVERRAGAAEVVEVLRNEDVVKKFSCPRCRTRWQRAAGDAGLFRGANAWLWDKVIVGLYSRRWTRTALLP